jgi:hypothetical protein
MTPRSTTAARAAAARRRRRSLHAGSADACPLCAADLGGVRSSTRRLVVFSSVPGEFRWRCPDCSGVWQESASGRQGAVATPASTPSC